MDIMPFSQHSSEMASPHLKVPSNARTTVSLFRMKPSPMHLMLSIILFNLRYVLRALRTERIVLILALYLYSIYIRHVLILITRVKFGRPVQ